MKTVLLITAFVIAAFSITSCASTRQGCKSSQGFVGYGSR